MSVEQGSDRVCNRILLIIAFHQNRVEGSNAPGLETAGPLYEPG